MNGNCKFSYQESKSCKNFEFLAFMRAARAHSARADTYGRKILKCSKCPGGQLPLKGGHHARTRKRVKRVVFHGRAMYARTVERVSKLPKFGKKGILFNSLYTRLGYIFY